MIIAFSDGIGSAHLYSFADKTNIIGGTIAINDQKTTFYKSGRALQFIRLHRNFDGILPFYVDNECLDTTNFYSFDQDSFAKSMTYKLSEIENFATLLLNDLPESFGITLDQDNIDFLIDRTFRDAQGKDFTTEMENTLSLIYPEDFPNRATVEFLANN